MRMHILEESDPELPIHVMMNSTGGSWFDALAIYDYVKSCEVQTSIECFGMCASAAVPIAQAFDERLIYPSTTIVIHNGTQSGEGGNTLDFEQWGLNSKRERERMYNLLSSRNQIPPDFWRQKCSEGDYIITPMQALELGLFDGVIGAAEQK